MVVAGQLPQARLLSPRRREVARRQAVHRQGRHVHVRPPARSAGRSGQAPPQSPAGGGRERGGRRRRRSPDGPGAAEAGPQLVITPVGTSVVDHLIINTRKAPFDSVKVREAVSRAIDRRALIAAVYQGGAVVGAWMAPRPYGVWGLVEGDLRGLPGYGNPGDEKAKARTLLAEAGFGPARPLKAEMLTRGLPAFADLSSFVISELKRVGIEASLRQVESSQWYPLQARGEFQIGTDRNGIEPDDPDAHFYEFIGCRSPRNYSGYRDEEITRLIEQHSQELDTT